MIKTCLKIGGIPALLCCMLLYGTGSVQALPEDHQGSVIRLAQAKDDGGEWQPQQPAVWKTISEVRMSMGFAEGWDTHEQKDAIVGVSPDGKVRIQAHVSEFTSVKETLANLERTFNSFCENLTLTDPQQTSEIHGLKVHSTGGTAKHKDSNESLEVAVDVVEANGKIVVIVIYGTHEGMMTHFADIVLSQMSLKPAQ